MYVSHGGVGAFPMGFVALLCFSIAFLSYQKIGLDYIGKSDWIFLTLALFTIPLWYVTSNALYAIILLSLIDLLGFVPTFKKAFSYPFDEQLSFFILMVIKDLFFVIPALEEHSLTTMLFPLTLSITTTLFVIMVYWRRKIG